jgi:hypothetical protein
MGVNTFPLRNQSLTLQSLKDQLGFLVTIIPGGDSLIHKTKKPKSIEGRREGATKFISTLSDIFARFFLLYIKQKRYSPYCH